MTSNLRPPSYGNSAFSHPYNPNAATKRYMEEDVLKTASLAMERKTFHLTLKANPRGQFLRITEDVQGRRNNIMVPSTGLAEFLRVVQAMTKACDEIRPDPMAKY